MKFVCQCWSTRQQPVVDVIDLRTLEFDVVTTQLKIKLTHLLESLFTIFHYQLTKLFTEYWIIYVVLHLEILLEQSLRNQFASFCSNVYFDECFSKGHQFLIVMHVNYDDVHQILSQVLSQLISQLHYEQCRINIAVGCIIPQSDIMDGIMPLSSIQKFEDQDLI